MVKIIPPSTLVPMDIFSGDFPLRIDLAYARPNMFEVIYRPGARLWLHEGLAGVVALASGLIWKSARMRCVLYDGLRTTNAQQKMLSAPAVLENPHWLTGEARLLSPPGAGGHPRGMAIDLSLETAEGGMVDMGTEFDHLAADPGPEHNPAHRHYKNLTETARPNRKTLTDAMVEAAALLDVALWPLPQEWWDFRLPAEVFNEFAPLSDSDLPPQMRMTTDKVQNALPDFPQSHFTALKTRIETRIQDHLNSN